MSSQRKRRLQFPMRMLTRAVENAQQRLTPAVETYEQGPLQFRTADPMRPKDNAKASVPWTLRVMAAFSWRLIVICAAAIGLLYAASQITIVLMPVAVALLLAVLLDPLLRIFHVHMGLNRTLSAALTLFSGVIFVSVMLSQALGGIIAQVPALVSRAAAGMSEVGDWIVSDPFNIGYDKANVDKFISTVNTEVSSWLTEHASTVAGSAISLTSTLAHFGASALITLFVLFFFLKDGRHIWLWLVRLLPTPAREPLHESAIRGWVTLRGYVGAQIKVAAIDAAGIGIGAAFVGVPMALPITVVVFFGSFIPIVGALISGAIAVFVAVVDQGLTAGLIMFVIILAVQQIEGHFLQPILMSSAVSIHPLAVLLAVAGGSSLAGIPGALFGVPVVAFLNSTLLYLHGYDPIPSLRTDLDRPGGPPGALHRLIAETYTHERQMPTWASVAASEESGDLGVQDTEKPLGESAGANMPKGAE